MIDVDALLAKARKPGELAMKYHRYYRGKIETGVKCSVREFADFAIWYTPGVAEPCRAIAKEPELVDDYTNRWNTVAVVSDGTRVLGLGDIGAKAAMPVMEGKALLFKYLGGVDAFPLCLDTKDPKVLVETVKLLQPSFGGINLEDISQPKCYWVLETLRNEAEIPVWHDDQQGTAAVTVAGLINALKVAGKAIGDARISMIGAGSANVATTRILLLAGADPAKLVLVDSKGTLHKGRTDLKEHKEKWHLCEATNARGVVGGIAQALAGADVCIALSRPGPGVIKPEWVREMGDAAVVFACANPVPEIWPWEAKEAGAAIVATGRSDFPNQVNNSLGFPGIFRGALDVRARTITDEMCLAAATELAATAADKGLSAEYIIPDMSERDVYPREAAAVGTKAIEQGVARAAVSREELYQRASTIIEGARRVTQTLMDQGIVPMPPQ